MTNPTHDEQIDLHLQYALNVAYAGQVDKVIPDAYCRVLYRLELMREAELPFVEKSALYGRKHGDPPRGEAAGAVADRLIEGVDDDQED